MGRAKVWRWPQASANPQFHRQDTPHTLPRLAGPWPEGHTCSAWLSPTCLTCPSPWKRRGGESPWGAPGGGGAEAWMEASDNQGLWGGPEGAGGLGRSALRGRHCHLLRVAPGPLLYLWHLGRPCICGAGAGVYMETQAWPLSHPRCDCTVPVHSPGPACALGHPGGPWVRVLTSWSVLGELRPWRPTLAHRTGCSGALGAHAGTGGEGQACVRGCGWGAAWDQGVGLLQGRRGSRSPACSPTPRGLCVQDVGFCLQVDTARLLPLSRL